MKVGLGVQPLSRRKSQVVRPGIVARRPGEAEVGVMVANEAVLGRGDILAPDRRQASLAGELDEMVQQELLDPPLQHAAAHQPRIDLEHVATTLARRTLIRPLSPNRSRSETVSVSQELSSIMACTSAAEWRRVVRLN